LSITGKSRTLLDVWSRQHHWQQRLRDLETQAAIAANERAAAADQAAKRKFAEQLEAERVAFVRRELSAAEKATSRGLLRFRQGNSMSDFNLLLKRHATHYYCPLA
jgi:hypothetical protein